MNLQHAEFKYLSKAKTIVLVVTMLFIGTSFSFAADENGKKINIGEMIFEHVGDAHSWHIAGNYAIPLPIIVYSSNQGVSMFSSSNLENGAIYKGYKLNGEHIVVANPDGTINNEQTAKIWDISLTKNATTIVFTGLLLLLIMTSVSKGYNKRGLAAPKGIQSFFEPIVLFVRDDISMPSIGKHKHEKFMPYLLTLFFFILFLNLLGLIPFFPGGANVTGNVAITLSFASFTFIVMMLNSNRTFWGHTLWMPGVPWWVKVTIITPLEILGIFLKPFTLIVRIFANMLAGHIVALSLVCLIFVFGAANAAVGYGVSLISIPFGVVMLLLDLLVSFIQAYVFTLLTAIYIGMVTAENEHH